MLQCTARRFSIYVIFQILPLIIILDQMDTIGDAYIVAGFLPPVGPDTLAGVHEREVRRVCEDVLEVSRAMLRAAEAHRRGDGRDVHCRIGISLGTVITGVLGRLQPRLHLFGEGMRAAESHEQAGEADAVHVNYRFMRALGSRASGPGPACLDLEATFPQLKPPTPTHNMGTGNSWLGGLSGDSGIYFASEDCVDISDQTTTVLEGSTVAQAGPQDSAEVQKTAPAGPAAKSAVTPLPGWVVVETAAPSAEGSLRRPPRLMATRFSKISRQSSFVLYPGCGYETADSEILPPAHGRAGSTAAPEHGPNRQLPSPPLPPE